MIPTPTVPIGKRIMNHIEQQEQTIRILREALELEKRVSRQLALQLARAKRGEA